MAAQPAPATTSSDPEPAAAWVPPNPTNAGKIFRWGNATWNDEFKTPLTSTWRVNRPAMVRDQHGMLTLDAPTTSGSVIAAAIGQNHQYGRWEARVRSRQYTTGNSPYTLVWELIPRNGTYNCGARSISISEYTLGTSRAALHIRNLPNLDFTTGKALALNNQEFHTYAVEVTPDHISWFIDTKVIRTERRPEALTGASYGVRFRLVGVPGATMNKSRMQMDWVRYYTLERKNAQPITAPQTNLTTFAGAC
jgi:hypothetical protein